MDDLLFTESTFYHVLLLLSSQQDSRNVTSSFSGLGHVCIDQCPNGEPQGGHVADERCHESNHQGTDIRRQPVPGTRSHCQTSSAASEEGLHPDQPLPRQFANPQRLQAESGGILQAYLRPQSHVPVQLKGYLLAEPHPALVGQPNGDELMAKRFLHANRDALLLNQADDQLPLNHRETGKLGRTVLRFSPARAPEAFSSSSLTAGAELAVFFRKSLR